MATYLKNQVEEIIKSCGIKLTFKGYNDKRKSFRRVKCYINSNAKFSKFVKMEEKMKGVFGDKLIKIQYAFGVDTFYHNFGDNVQVYFKL